MTKARNKFEEAWKDFRNRNILNQQFLTLHAEAILEALQIAADSVVVEGVISAEEFWHDLAENWLDEEKSDADIIDHFEQRDRQLLAEANREIGRLREALGLIACRPLGGTTNDYHCASSLQRIAKQALETK